MGDIAFNIFKDVDLNKTVDLEINKNVDVNVNIDGQLATASADAEAFGSPALAEVDAYTFVNEGLPVFVPHPGSVQAIGNIPDFVELFIDIDPPDGLPDGIEITFGIDGIIAPPDVDSITGFGNLEPLTPPPPPPGAPLPDAPLPQPYLSIGNLILQQQPDSSYVSSSPWVVNFGERALDVDSDGLTGTGPLTLTLEAGARFSGSFVEAGDFEIQFEAGDAFFTYDDTCEEGITNYPVTAFFLEAFNESTPEIDSTWFLQATSDFGCTFPGDGEAFAYAESTAAIDDLISPMGIIGDRVWNDTNRNGLQENGESGWEIPIPVRLLDETGNKIDETMTNEEGLYFFTGLSAGTYRVEFNISELACIGGPCRFTEKNVGNDDTIDSDVTGNGAIGITDEINLAPGEINLDIDAGIVDGTAILLG